ncbi:hypothetical protein DSUL_50341 [Desulfovibrionales bacterium]
MNLLTVRPAVVKKITMNVSGAVAQLGERLNGIQEAVGSIPSSSTKMHVVFPLISSHSSTLSIAEPYEMFNLLYGPYTSAHGDDVCIVFLSLSFPSVCYLINL